MSAWNGVADDPNGDACCACHDAADPGRYVAGLGLLCQECTRPNSSRRTMTTSGRWSSAAAASFHSEHEPTGECEMTLYCPDCGVKGRLIPERDEETGELIGFECDACHNLFEDAVIDDDT